MKIFAIGFLALTVSAQAQSGDWPRVESVGHRHTLIVETDVNAYGPANFTRCHVIAVDTTTLTCKTLGWAGKRVVFPAVRIDAVYRVKESWVGPVLGASVLGIFIGGVVSGNPQAIGVGAIGGILWLIIDSARSSARAWRAWWNGNDPLPPDERRELLYLRPAPPAPSN